MAVKALRDKEVQRIILTRPAVEAGESSVFCRAICIIKSIRICDRHDALYEMLGRES